jgi:hypothetical protein
MDHDERYFQALDTARQRSRPPGCVIPTVAGSRAAQRAWTIPANWFQLLKEPPQLARPVSNPGNPAAQPSLRRKTARPATAVLSSDFRAWKWIFSPSRSVRFAGVPAWAGAGPVHFTLSGRLGSPL